MIQGVYKHYKGGTYYVLGFAKHTETNEELVIYSDSKGKAWARPKEMFMGFVELNENCCVQRFTHISEVSK